MRSPKRYSQKNIKNMHRILNETNIVELFESESELIPLNELSEILLTSILIPSSCGYEKEVRSFAEKFLNAQRQQIFIIKFQKILMIVCNFFFNNVGIS